MTTQRTFKNRPNKNIYIELIFCQEKKKIKTRIGEETSPNARQALENR